MHVNTFFLCVCVCVGGGGGGGGEGGEGSVCGVMNVCRCA